MSVVLYEEDGAWRWSAVTARAGKSGLTCGRVPGRLTEDEAKATLLRSLAASDGVELDGKWRSDKPGWHAADLKPAAGR